MTSNRPIVLTLVAALALPAAAGCLKRTEVITVHSDGSVAVALEYESKDRDFGAPDAMPSVESGWAIEIAAHKKKDDSEEYTLSAQRNFAPDEPLPASFAAPGDPSTDLYLDFPTTLRSEQRDDGLYFHFRRVYSPRPWAYVQYWQERIFDDKLKKLSESPKEELTREQRVRLLRAFAAVEAFKQIELARAALTESGVTVPPDRWLLARRALLDAYEEVDYDRFLELEDRVRDEEQKAEGTQAAEKQMNREAEQIIQRAEDAFLAALQTDLSPVEYAAFERAHERARRYYEITDETGGHFFEIHVKMPGRIVAHNADKINENGEAVWEFDGRAFRDRPYELLITSRLQADEKNAHD